MTLNWKVCCPAENARYGRNDGAIGMCQYASFRSMDAMYHPRRSVWRTVFVDVIRNLYVGMYLLRALTSRTNLGVGESFFGTSKSRFKKIYELAGSITSSRSRSCTLWRIDRGVLRCGRRRLSGGGPSGDHSHLRPRLTTLLGQPLGQRACQPHSRPRRGPSVPVVFLGLGGGRACTFISSLPGSSFPTPIGVAMTGVVGGLLIVARVVLGGGVSFIRFGTKGALFSSLL